MKDILKTLSLSMTLSLSATPLFAANGPDDAEIAHIVVTANTIDIDAGKIAEKKGSSKEVKDFAKRMITDHKGVNTEATALVTRLGVKPMDNDTSKDLMKGAKDNMAQLNKLKGMEFDKQYIDHEVTYHEAVLSALDKTLIPNARNTALKGLLIKVRPAFVAHLEHARGLQLSMNKK